MNPIYIPDFVENHKEVFDRLLNGLDWKRYGSKPRKEYYCNDHDVTYSYGSAGFADVYHRSPYTDDILNIRAKLEDELKVVLDVCFLNLYEDFAGHLGWHADDSPEMDHNRPIITVSLGAEREIWFKEMPNPEIEFKDKEKKDKTVIKLKSGSACIMPAGMQKTHLHRIPKCDKADCGPRISLTFRGYVPVV